jgi:hypothetical protein
MLFPGEIREIKDYILARRKSRAPFDIAVNVEVPPDRAQGVEAVRPYLRPAPPGALSLPQRSQKNT